MTRSSISVAICLWSISATAVVGASRCDEGATAASHLRLARTSQDSRGHSANDDNCRTFIKQFVEAIAAREAAATCQDSVAHQRSLELLDGEIQAFNDRIAEQSCGQ